MTTNSINAAKYHYYSKDHLGNVRSVVTKSTFTNAVTEVQKTHYYPFGGIIADLSTGRSAQNRLYNGKELDTSNNLWWYDYGARQYDPTAPRFTTADPLAENNYNTNSYVYCHNNPIMRIDPDGRDDYFSNTGKFLYSKGTGANIIIRDNGKPVNFNQYNLRNADNMQMAANIVGHYARAVGIEYDRNGGTGSVGVNTLHQYDHNGRTLAGTDKGNIYIKITNGHLDDYMYNLYQLQSTLIHENQHKNDQKKGIKKATNIRHAEIVLEEMKSESFSKSSKEYQSDQRHQFHQHIQAAEKEQGCDMKAIQDLLQQFYQRQQELRQ